ncbi:MAG: SsgA family sporulation/cell division regulator [Candidatus Nanopelagicales bacterium]
MTMPFVSAELDLTLVMDDDRTLQVPSTLVYAVDNPYAVTAVFRTADGDVTWVFGRDLLDDGLIEPAGEGDVTVWPTVVAGRPVVCLALASPAGSALLQLDAGALRVFLDESYELVEMGHEGEHLDIDAALAELLGDAPTR